MAFGPGGGTDIVGRIIAQRLQEKLGQPVVMENRPGAAGTLGNEAVARAEKDGYTLGIMTAGQIIAAVMNKSLRYDTLTAFDPIAQVASAGLLIVTRPDFPAATSSNWSRPPRRSRQALVCEPRLRRHPAFHQRAVSPDRRHQGAAGAVPHLAGGDRGGAGPAG